MEKILTLNILLCLAIIIALVQNIAYWVIVFIYFKLLKDYNKLIKKFNY